MEAAHSTHLSRAFFHTADPPEHSVSRRDAKIVAVSVVLTIVGGALLSTFSLPTINDAKWWQFATIGLLFTLTLFSNIHVRVGQAELTVSYADVPLTMCVLVVNPWLAVAARLLGLVIALAARKRDTRRFAFNCGLFIFDTAVTYSIVRLLGGGSFTLSSLGATLLGVVLGGVVTAHVVMGYFSWLHGTPRWGLSNNVMTTNAITGAAGAILGAAAAFIMTESEFAVPAILVLFFSVLFVTSRSRRHHKRMSSLARFATKADSVKHDGDELPHLLLREACTVVGGHDAVLLVGEEHRGAVPVVRTAAWTGRGRYLRAVHGLPPSKCAVEVPLTVWDNTPALLVVSRRTAELGVFTKDHVSYLAPLVSHAMSCWTMATLAAAHLERSQRDDDTGLINESGFRAADEPCGEPGRLAACQLEGYSGLMAAFGVEVAQELFRHVAGRLQEQSVSLPGSMAVRLSEEVLGVWLPQGSAEELTRIVRHLRLPYQLGALSMDVDVRVGFADAHQPGPVGPVIDRAMSALAHASALNAVEPFEYNARDDRTYIRRATLAADLPAALRSGTLCARLSPFVELSSNSPKHVLVEPEWAHPEFGMVSAAEFLPFAEQSQMTGDVVWWTLEEAAQAYASWCGEFPELGVAVVVTRQEIASRDFAERLVAWLGERNVPASCVAVKVPEAALSGALDDVRDTMTVLRDAGVSLTLTNVGAGFSSLSVFRELPLTGVSFDASLTKDVAKDLDRQSLLKNMVALVHDVGLTVSASGVASSRAASFLAACGCDAASGPVVAKAMTRSQAKVWATGVKGLS